MTNELRDGANEKTKRIRLTETNNSKRKHGGAMHTGISRCMNIVSVTFSLFL